MRELTSNEVNAIAGGELECTVGIRDVSCTGTPSDFYEAGKYLWSFAAYCMPTSLPFGVRVLTSHF